MFFFYIKQLKDPEFPGTFVKHPGCWSRECLLATPFTHTRCCERQILGYRIFLKYYACAELHFVSFLIYFPLLACWLAMKLLWVMPLSNIWNLLPNDIKIFLNLDTFKTLIMSWNGPRCQCSLCNVLS